MQNDSNNEDSKPPPNPRPKWLPYVAVTVCVLALGLVGYEVRDYYAPETEPYEGAMNAQIRDQATLLKPLDKPWGQYQIDKGPKVELPGQPENEVMTLDMMQARTIQKFAMYHWKQDNTVILIYHIVYKQPFEHRPAIDNMLSQRIYYYHGEDPTYQDQVLMMYGKEGFTQTATYVVYDNGAVAVGGIYGSVRGSKRRHSDDVYIFDGLTMWDIEQVRDEIAPKSDSEQWTRIAGSIHF